MKINNKEYTLPELNFNTLCELEDMGVSLSDFNTKAMSTVRAFIALEMGGDLNKAGKEFEAHLINGGDVKQIVDEINKTVNESGFFRALAESSPKRDAKSRSKKDPKTAEV